MVYIWLASLIKCDLSLNNNRWRTWKPVKLALCSQTNQIYHDRLLLIKVTTPEKHPVLWFHSTGLLFPLPTNLTSGACCDTKQTWNPNLDFSVDLRSRSTLFQACCLMGTRPSHTPLQHARQGCWWKYLLPAVARYLESACKAELRLRLLDVCLFLKCGQRSRTLLLYYWSSGLSDGKS